jgi:hypothetical protein
MKRAPMVLVTTAVLAACWAQGSGTAGASDRFERTYTPSGRAHVTISGVTGDIAVTAWNRKLISVKATTSPPATVDEQVSGNEIVIWVKRRVPPGRADFEVFLPPETILSLSNVVGSIEVTGMTGDLSVTGFNCDARLRNISARTVEVKVTTGDIVFDGQLHRDGSYSLQAVKGDIDVTLPANSPFELDARSLSGAINLGDFVNSLSGGAMSRKLVSGSHLAGGPRLSLTTFNGKVLLHKK